MAIEKILLSDAKPGMKLANDICDDVGRLVVPYGTVLNRTIIERMEDYKVVVIKVVKEDEQEKFFEQNQQKDQESEQKTGYFEKLKNSEGFKEFETTFNTSLDDFKTVLNDVVLKNNEVDIGQMLDGVKKIIEANKTGYSMLDALACMRGYDDMTYVHSMNVALICNMMAGWLHYSEEDTDMLTAAGLLHDIGKVRIPKEIICKPGKLTDIEYQIIKSHPTLGYDVLKDMLIDEHIKLGALMHHERYDGGGYPGRIKGNQIDEVARIVAVADVYDAMTANRVYREGLCPFDVILHFENEMAIYDPKYLLLFLEKTAETYIRNRALLSDGREAEILMINKTVLGRPVVMVGNDAVDLSRQKDIKIVKLL